MQKNQDQPAGQTEPRNEPEPVINILGEKVALGPLQKEHLPAWHRWMNDFEVTIRSGDSLRPTTLESIQAEYEQLHKEEGQQKEVSFVIYERATMRHIGFTGLREINYRNRTATFGIVIGEKDCWNKGYGTEATKLVLDYGFFVLNLHNVLLSTYAYNKGAYKAYERAGFRLIGHRREAHRWGERVYDEILMDCLASEFQRPSCPVIEQP